MVWQTVINGLIHLALAGVGYAWHTAEALREARERVARAEVLRARAELQLLRSQLHPHFVLNVLHALLGLVRRDPARAESALERLGELLRFGQWVQQTGSDWVPLSREWELRPELPRARARAPGRPPLRRDRGGRRGARGRRFRPFALQPLVENAIVHAVAPRASGGRVESRRGGRAAASASRSTDDGPGRLGSEIAASPRMGLRLLQERLAGALRGPGARSPSSRPPGEASACGWSCPTTPSPETA